jgi:hypothetical protein
MKPYSKSVWMTPAGGRAFQPLPIVQARDSFGPAVATMPASPGGDRHRPVKENES